MDTTFALVIGLLAGGSLAALFVAVLPDHRLRRANRNLASAFAGEVAAIMRTIETSALADPAGAPTDRAAPPLALPRCVVYEADAQRIDQLPAPLPRELSYFYTRLAALKAEIAGLRPAVSSTGGAAGADSVAERIHHDVEETLAIGEDTLRELQPLISRPVRRRPPLHAHGAAAAKPGVR